MLVPADRRRWRWRKLTLAMKFESVHRNTTTSSSVIPSVRLATPPRPSLARTPPAVAAGAAGSAVPATSDNKGDCDTGPASMPAADGDLRREKEEEEEEDKAPWRPAFPVCASGARSPGRSGSVGAMAE